jgi:flagellar hook protein FlgE
MSLLQTAVSGLQSTKKAMSSVFDDIANGLSIGHKESRPVFSSLVASSGRSFASGGTQCIITRAVNSQGVLQNSASAIDLAISGNGFFVTSAQPDVLDIQYTRAGMCTTDKNGDLITVTGAYLLGFADTDIDDKGDPLPTVNQSDVNSLKHINVNRVVGIAKATQNLALQGNLPSTDAVGTTETANISVYDALGARHILTLTFTRTVMTPATWTLTITSSDGTILDNTTSNPYNITITFDGEGRPTSFGGGATPPAILCNWNPAITSAAPTLINFDLGVVNTLEGLTCRASDYFKPISQQDGRQFGTFRNVTIDADGRVSAVYSNGQSSYIARIVLANFAAPDQLEALNGDSWIETDASGPYVLSLPNRGGIGKIVAGTLEASTVDLAAKLTELIELNNLYAANTKSIKADRETFDFLIHT